MEPEGSLPYPQQPATDPYSEPDASSPLSYPISLISIPVSSFHLQRVLLCCLFPSGFLTKIFYIFHICPVRVTCPAHVTTHLATYLRN